MKQLVKLIYPLVVLAGSSNAYAEEDCQFYVGQIERMLSANNATDALAEINIAKRTEAKELFKQGKSLCESGKISEGEALLQQAIQLLGSN